MTRITLTTKTEIALAYQLAADRSFRNAGAYRLEIQPTYTDGSFAAIWSDESDWEAVKYMTNAIALVRLFVTRDAGGFGFEWELVGDEAANPSIQWTNGFTLRNGDDTTPPLFASRVAAAI